MTEPINYADMDGSHMLQAVGDDASKWAAAFCQKCAKLGHEVPDEGWMTGWFANAIEHSGDVRRWRKSEQTPPTGEKVWTCKIGGPVDVLPPGADSPMRNAVESAYREITGNDHQFNFSGWGGCLDECERAVVEDRLPVDAARHGLI